MKDRNPQFLYLGTDGKLLKIGITDNLELRGKALGITFLKTWRRPYARSLESAIKGMFAYACVRGSEWFDVPEAEFLFEVQRLIRIEDDHRAMLEGREPSKRPAEGEPPFIPPFELPHLASCSIERSIR